MKPNYKKIVQTINFFAGKMNGRIISKLDMLKLVFLADRYHMRKFGTMITKDTYLAMDLGPVPSVTKKIAEHKFRGLDPIKGYAENFIETINKDRISSKRSFDPNEFSTSELEALNSAFLVFQQEANIVKYTHRFPEWKKFQRELRKGSRKEKMNLLDFFTVFRGKDYCQVSNEHLKLSREIFEEENSFDRLLE